MPNLWLAWVELSSLGHQSIEAGEGQNCRYRPEKPDSFQPEHRGPGKARAVIKGQAGHCKLPRGAAHCIGDCRSISVLPLHLSIAAEKARQPWGADCAATYSTPIESLPRGPPHRDCFPLVSQLCQEGCTPAKGAAHCPGAPPRRLPHRVVRIQYRRRGAQTAAEGRITPPRGC